MKFKESSKIRKKYENIIYITSIEFVFGFKGR